MSKSKAWAEYEDTCIKADARELELRKLPGYIQMLRGYTLLKTPCGCEINGDGNLQSPFRIVFCKTHRVQNGDSPHRQRRQVILNDVLEERAAQDKQWGGADHDYDHDESDWCAFIRKQLGYADGASLSSKQKSLAEYRSRMVKIAALAVAALESFDRRNS